MRRLCRLYLAYERVLLPLATFAVLLGGWELGVRSGALDRFFFSMPTAILAAGVGGDADCRASRTTSQ